MKKRNNQFQSSTEALPPYCPTAQQVLTKLSTFVVFLIELLGLKILGDTDYELYSRSVFPSSALKNHLPAPVFRIQDGAAGQHPPMQHYLNQQLVNLVQ